MNAEAPAPDQAPGVPHPRDAARFFGHGTAEATFLQAFATGRLHHGWLLTGPRGVGKATLAWRIARFFLATPEPEDSGLFAAPPAPDSMEIDADHPVARRIRAGSEPGLFSITRSLNEKGKMRDQIVVEDIRRLGNFFRLSAAEGGRRVVIVDAADEMNASAANALLKMLEEPPARALLLLVSHLPSGLLPTVRSRCLTLRLTGLNALDLSAALEQAGLELPPEQDALAALACGSAGAAARLITLGGLGIYAELVGLMAGLPRLDRQRALALAEAPARKQATERFRLLSELFDIFLARLARTGARGVAPVPAAAEGEAEVLLRLSPGPEHARIWASLAATITARMQHGLAVNLDPAALVLDTVTKIQDAASRL